jgi:hypothetical protein
MSGSRKNRGDEAASFDSLLDTMTNVVGILVIVLVITQLGVQKAVKRIEENLPTVTPEQLEAARRAAAEPAADPEKIARELAALKPPTEAELAALRKQIEELRRRLLKDPAVEKEIAQLQAKLADLEKRKAEAEKKEDEEARRKKDLEAKLSQTAVRQAPPALVIPMPAPRPAEKGSVEVTVLCRHNRVIPIDVAALRDYVVGRMRTLRSVLLAAGAPPGEQGRTAEDPLLCDPEKVKAFFKQHPVGTRDLDFAANIVPERRVRNLVVLPKPTAGESAEQARAPTSRFHLFARQLAGKPNHIRFLVWPDSFEAYIEARKICDRLNVPAGWDVASASNWEITMDPRIKIKGEAPPPKPVPGAPPPPPAKPRNVLD